MVLDFFKPLTSNEGSTWIRSDRLCSFDFEVHSLSDLFHILHLITFGSAKSF